MSWYLQIQSVNEHQRRIRSPIRDVQLIAEIFDTPTGNAIHQALSIYPQVNYGVRYFIFRHR
jgi:hypothetical protein